MPENTSSTTLYRIDECSDVMADACVGDDQGNLIFLSIWARDTAVQQFLARLTLGRDEQGLDQFHVITGQGGSLPVFVGSVDRLEKRLTRSYHRTLFGSMVNLWLFDQPRSGEPRVSTYLLARVNASPISIAAASPSSLPVRSKISPMPVVSPPT